MYTPIIERPLYSFSVQNHNMSNFPDDGSTARSFSSMILTKKYWDMTTFFISGNSPLSVENDTIGNTEEGDE